MKKQNRWLNIEAFENDILKKQISWSSDPELTIPLSVSHLLAIECFQISYPFCILYGNGRKEKDIPFTF